MSRPRAALLANASVLTLTVGLFSTGCATAPKPEAQAPPAAAPRAVAAAPAPAKVPLLSDWRDAVLYFVIVDRFADGDAANNRDVDPTKKGTFHGGDYAGLTKHLDEIASLGVNALWITPVVTNIPGFVTGAGFPDWGYHGYWADDFRSLDARFGAEAELKALVDACHAKGMRVLLDVVYNHAGYDSRYTKDPKTRGWLRNNEKGDCGQDDLTSCVSGLPDFRTELPEVADYLLSAQVGWAKRLGVDGFRLDTVKHVDHPFWKEHRTRTREAMGKGFFLVGEVWGGDAKVLDPWFEGDEMDAGFDFGFQGSTIGWVLGRGRTVAYERYLESRERVRPGYLLSHYLSSHDVPGGLLQLEGDLGLFRLAAALQMTTSGIPMVYYGEEVGRKGGDWPDNRSDMPWGDRDVRPGAGVPRDEALRKDYATLVGIRKACPALTRGTHRGLSTDGDLLVFQREDAASGDAVVVAVNRGSDAATARFALPAAWGAAQEVRDLFSGAAFPVGAPAEGGTKAEVPVPPRSFRILAR